MSLRQIKMKTWITVFIITAAISAVLLLIFFNGRSGSSASVPDPNGTNVTTQDTNSQKPTDANAPEDANAPACKEDPNKPSDANTPSEPNTPAEVNDVNVVEDTNEAMNLKDVEFKNLVQKLAEWTDKVIIPDAEAMKQKFTIYSAKKIPRAQALELIYSALRVKGFVAEHTEDAIFIKPIKDARLGFVPTVPAGQPLALIESKQQIVQKFFKLNSYEPARMSEIISPLIGEYGYVSADENTQSLLVIDTVENLMRIERIIAQFDVPEAEQTVTRVFELKTADPAEIVQLLRLLLDTNPKSARRNSGRSGSQSSSKGKDKEPTIVTIDSAKAPIILIPDGRRKWIIAKASADDIEDIAAWIEKLDKEQMVESESETISVLYADVREVATSIEQALRNTPGNELRQSVLVRPLPQARQIMIFGRPELREMVKNMIAEIDMPTGQFLTEAFELEFADADQIKKNLDELYGEERNSRYSYYYYRYGNQNSSDTVKVISFPSMQQITVIASPENMEKIRTQIVEWDTPIEVEKVKPRIIEVQNSDPVRLADLLSKLFSEQTDSRSSIYEMIFGRSMTKEKIVGPLYGQLTFEAVPDTKKIIVISKIAAAYGVVEELIRDLDSMEVAELPMVVTLNYADPEELCDQLNAILNEPGTPVAIQRRQRGLSEYSMKDENKSNSAAKNDNSNNSANLITPWWTSSRNRFDKEMPTSNLIGRIRFIPVERSKAILVLSPVEYQQSVKQMIEELDKPGKQVMVKAVIVQVDHSKMTSLGVQIATDPTAFGVLTENSAEAVTKLSYLDTHGAWTLDMSTNVTTLVDLLIKKANAKVLNQPTLWMKDNEEAIFFKGQNVAFIEGSQTDNTGAALKTTFNYKDVGVTLRVRPNITPENNVGIIINLIVEQVEPQLINTQVATNKLDTLTHMIVKDGETIMLGGILFQTDSKIHRKIPLLGDLPLIGAVFNHWDVQVANSELLVFITPYVVEDTDRGTGQEVLDEAGDKFDTIVQDMEQSMQEITDPNFNTD